MSGVGAYAPHGEPEMAHAISVWKVSHHGSNTSSRQIFVNQVCLRCARLALMYTQISAHCRWQRCVVHSFAAAECMHTLYLLWSSDGEREFWLMGSLLRMSDALTKAHFALVIRSEPLTSPLCRKRRFDWRWSWSMFVELRIQRLLATPSLPLNAAIDSKFHVQYMYHELSKM